MNLLKKIGGKISKGLDVLSGIVTNPITAVTKGVKESTAKFNAGTRGENVAKALTTGAGAALAVVGIGAAASAGTAATVKAVAKAVANNPKKSVAAAVAIPIVTKSTKVQQGVEDLPGSVYNFGSNIGNLIDNPSLANAATVVKQNPLISASIAAAAGVGVAAAGAGVANIVSSYRNTKAVKENSAIQQQAARAAEPATIIIQQVPVPLSPPVVASGVTAPVEMEASNAPKPKKKKKKSKKKAKKKKKTRRSKKKKTIKRKKSKR